MNSNKKKGARKKRPILSATKTVWRTLPKWPVRDPATWLGIPADMVAECRERHNSGYLFERLTCGRGSRSTEVRIPCKRGELYPVGDGRWGWSGPWWRYARRLRLAAGPACTGPFGTGVLLGGEGSEFVIWFPADRLDAVAKVVRAKRRSALRGRKLN